MPLNVGRLTRSYRGYVEIDGQPVEGSVSIKITMTPEVSEHKVLDDPNTYRVVDGWTFEGTIGLKQMSDAFLSAQLDAAREGRMLEFTVMGQRTATDGAVSRVVCDRAFINGAVDLLSADRGGTPDREYPLGFNSVPRFDPPLI